MFALCSIQWLVLLLVLNMVLLLLLISLLYVLINIVVGQPAYLLTTVYIHIHSGILSIVIILSAACSIF